MVCRKMRQNVFVHEEGYYHGANKTKHLPYAQETDVLPIVNLQVCVMELWLREHGDRGEGGKRHCCAHINTGRNEKEASGKRFSGTRDIVNSSCGTHNTGIGTSSIC